MKSVWKNGMVPMSHAGATAVAHQTLCGIGRCVDGVVSAFVQKELNGKTWLCFIVPDVQFLSECARRRVEQEIMDLTPSWLNLGFRWMTPADVSHWLSDVWHTVGDLKAEIERLKALAPDLEAADKTLEQLKREDEPQRKYRVNGVVLEGALDVVWAREGGVIESVTPNGLSAGSAVFTSSGVVRR